MFRCQDFALLSSAASASYFDGHFVSTSVAWKYPSGVNLPFRHDACGELEVVRGGTVQHHPALQPLLRPRDRSEPPGARVEGGLLVTVPGSLELHFLPFFFAPAISVYSTLLSMNDICTEHEKDNDDESAHNHFDIHTDVPPCYLRFWFSSFRILPSRRKR